MDKVENHRSIKKSIRNWTQLKKVGFSELDSLQIRNWTPALFGIGLITKMLQTTYSRVITNIIKSIIKVFKKLFLFKREMWISQLL